MTHTCHWPGCNTPVDPKLWGCRVHWDALPSHLRLRIGKAYRQGQEQRKDPSDEYMKAARAVQEWIAQSGQASGDLFGGEPMGP